MTKSNANTEVAEEFTSKYNRTPEIDKEFMAKVKGTESQTVLSPSLRYDITAEERIQRQAKKLLQQDHYTYVTTKGRSASTVSNKLLFYGNSVATYLHPRPRTHHDLRIRLVKTHVLQFDTQICERRSWGNVGG
jgi:hypothetical protein